MFAVPQCEDDVGEVEVRVKDILRFDVGWLILGGATTFLYVLTAGIIYFKMEMDHRLYEAPLQTRLKATATIQDNDETLQKQNADAYFHRAGLFVLLPGALAWFALGTIVPCLICRVCAGDAFKQMCRGLRIHEADLVFQEARTFESLSKTVYKTAVWFDILVSHRSRCCHVCFLHVSSVMSLAIFCALGPYIAFVQPELAWEHSLLPFGFIGLVGSLLPALLGLLALTHVCLARVMQLIRRIVPDLDDHWPQDVRVHDNNFSTSKDHWKNMLHDVIVLDRDLERFWDSSQAGAAWIIALGSLACLMTFSALFLIEAWGWQRQAVGVVSTATCGAMFLYGIGVLSNVTAAISPTKSTSLSLRTVLSSWMTDAENRDFLLHGRLLDYLATHEMGAGLGDVLITRALVSDVLLKFVLNVPILITVGRKLMSNRGS